MTYKKLVDELIKTMLEQPNVRYAGYGDIYTLNAKADIDYDVCFITPAMHRIDGDFMYYQNNLFYISRWDETLENQLNIHSAGIIALKEILDRFESKHPEVDVMENIQIQTAWQRFSDVCAVVWFTVTFRVPIDSCYSDYEEDGD